MNGLLKKLNFKPPADIVIWNAPTDFQEMMVTWQAEANVITTTPKESISFGLAFCKTQAEVNFAAELLLPLATGDSTIWFCYPKGTSKKYTCDFNRDTGWQTLGEAGWEPVRMVAIDADWSALRFRKPIFIKTMLRSSAISEQGKRRINPAANS